MEINFHFEEVAVDLDETAIKEWLFAVAKIEEKTIIGLNYIFCSDEYLLKINQEYLKHDYYTDIITFPYKQGHEIESDLFISTDRVKDNALSMNEPKERELHRVIVHGLLHLMGYGDKSEQDEKIMRSAEDHYLEYRKKPNGLIQKFKKPAS